MDLIKKMKELASKQSAGKEWTGNSVLELFRSVRFNIPRAQFVVQEEIVAANLQLNESSCLGRVAQLAALAEKHFPQIKLELGEVWGDALAGIMLNKLHDDPAKRFDPSFMQELLMYEEPHLVIFANGEEFEPISLELGIDIKHPRVQRFPVWEIVAASYLVSKSHTTLDPEEKLAILQEAERVCPGTAIVAENMALPYELLGRMKECRLTVLSALEKRRCARNLYVSYLLTQDHKYYKELIDKYTEEVVKYF